MTGRIATADARCAEAYSKVHHSRTRRVAAALIAALSACARIDAQGARGPTTPAQRQDVTLDSLARDTVRGPRLLVQNRYYAAPGKAREVYEWRLHASAVLRALGLHSGEVFHGDGGAEPDAIWQLTLDSATLMREARVARTNPEFQKVMEHMGTLTRRFESGIYREQRLDVETTGGDTATLRRDVVAWIARERDAYRRSDAIAFQPCPDPHAIVLRDVTGAAHECANVQEHMRDRMGGELTIVIDSLSARGDEGTVYNTLRFHRRVPRAGRVEDRVIIALHRDRWQRIGNAWRLIQMVETAPQRILIDGKPQPNRVP